MTATVDVRTPRAVPSKLAKIHPVDEVLPIARAIRADGVATFIGGILNSFPYTCFAENVGPVRLTQVRAAGW
jgi:xanthine/uracil permease